MTPHPTPTRPSSARTNLRRVTGAAPSVKARGEPMLWLCAGALAVALFMVFGLLLLVLVQGTSTFWPLPLVQVRLADGSVHLGEPTRADTYTPTDDQLAAMPAAVQERARAQLAANDGRLLRRMLRTGNFKETQTHFTWIEDCLVEAESRPAWAMTLERQAWGRFNGVPVALLEDGKPVATEPTEVVDRFEREHGPARARFAEIEELRKHGIGALSDAENVALLAARRAAIDHGAGSPQHNAAIAAHDSLVAANDPRRVDFEKRIETLLAENHRHQLRMRIADGREFDLDVADIVRAYAPNRLSTTAKLGVYASRWREFLFDDPRESNNEGGVWPAIFGTILMTLLMSLVVVPFGVLAALYMREYAKGGLIISAVRIAVNNLAGVPSIVFGVFGLGFFCYIIGGTIDALFYPENLPLPTFGKAALVWASLTLALLTLPVVIVATEEALAAVPGSMREGSYACGASKWQTIRRIVLPRAMPGILTGMILAMARGAGEVAPLMLVGAAKMAPELPLDGEFPYLHPSRSFMHLGFHIFDLGFQSQNSLAAKSMVFTTTLLLIGVITVLNLSAIWLRSRLRRKFVGAQF